MGPEKYRARGATTRWFAPTALGTVFVLLAVWPAAAQMAALTAEYRSKANFLATFPSFIEWPDEAFSKSGAPFVLCVVGDFQFGTSLAEMTRSVSPHGRRVEVRWVHKDPELRNCHLLFVSRSEAKRYAKVLQVVQGVDVLTVGETPDFLSAGGAMSFFVSERIVAVRSESPGDQRRAPANEFAVTRPGAPRSGKAGTGQRVTASWRRNRITADRDDESNREERRRHDMEKTRDASQSHRVDMPELLSRVDNDRELLRDLLMIFKEDFPRHLEELRGRWRART